MSTYVEECAGRAADYRVYYRRIVRGKSKVFFDAIWADTPEEAKATFLGFAKEARMKVTLIGVRPNKESAK